MNAKPESKQTEGQFSVRECADFIRAAAQTRYLVSYDLDFETQHSFRTSWCNDDCILSCSKRAPFQRSNAMVVNLLCVFTTIQ